VWHWRRLVRAFLAGKFTNEERATAIQCDVGKVADGQRFIAEAVSQLGHVDILVNNAGIEKHADF
jgi:NAD(P)-dependent dehydrogenase (short-subunit alcohol dehydrogenase family)